MVVGKYRKNNAVKFKMNMESQGRVSRMQTAKHPTFIYFILIAVVSETFLIHFNATSQSMKLSLRIDDLEKELSINKGELAELRSIGSNEKHFYVKHVKDIHKNIQSRVRRGIQKNSQSILRALDKIRSQILRVTKSDFVDKRGCSNVTLVCKKGDRGPRGKPGPRGYKGDIGSKGERGIIGPVGKTGPVGVAGEKGQKGDRGQPGASIERPKMLTKLLTPITKAESENLTLFCEASGNPPSNIRWEFSSQTVNSRYTFPVRGGLLITNVSKRDEGRIQCIAENILGKDTSETKLIVHTMPDVELQSDALTATEGIPFEVVCRADGSPIPKLKWKSGFGYLAARQILSKDQKSLALRFNKPSSSDAGLYICEAHNIIGMVEKPVLLTVDARDCSGYKGKRKSGIYTINPDGKQSFRVFCDMQTGSGGWTVIQRRTDGTMDFFKNWFEYKLGFGTVDKEFWLGNEKIHRLTKRGNTMIRFDLEDVSGNKVFAEYKVFYIDGESDNYKVHVTTYSGTAGDSFSGTNGMQFSTKDRDNDIYNGNCATQFHGAWWYSNCHASNLNGKYLHGLHKSHADGINWLTFKGHYYSLKSTEIKVRPVS